MNQDTEIVRKILPKLPHCETSALTQDVTNTVHLDATTDCSLIMSFTHPAACQTFSPGEYCEKPY